MPSVTLVSEDHKALKAPNSNMKNEMEIIKKNEMKVVNESSVNQILNAQCDDCDVAFNSSYHLENHKKSSQHLIKSGLDRKFKYKLNQKATKSKLLKGALKASFEKDVKSKCTILHFNDGSYFYSVLPTVESWKENLASNTSINVDNFEIKVIEVKPGKDIGGMCVDTLIRFEINGNKVVTHCYNTKPKILINGTGCKQFVEQYLEPYFKNCIGENLLQIQNYNNVVTETLGNAKRKDVKYRPGSKLSCNKCEFSSDTSSNMSTHKRDSHSNVMNNRSSYFEAIDNTKAITSTRDNSIVGILNEDISVIDLLDDTTDLAINTRETLEEVLISPTKNQFSADSKGEIQEEMNKLEKKTIDKETQKEEKDQSKEDTVQNKECNQINEGTNNEQHTPKKENNETHRKEAEEQDKKKKEEGEIKIDDEIEVKNVDIKVHTENRPVTVELSTCILCGFESGDNNSLEDHMKLSHDQNKSPKEARNHIFSCASCGFTSKTSRGLDRHIENRCSQCNICLAGNIEAEIHASLHSECEKNMCSFIYDGTANLKNHVADKHPKNKFPCTKCKNISKSEKDLLEHFNNNHREQKKSSNVQEAGTQTLNTKSNYPCEKCEFEDKDITVLVKHILNVHCLPALKLKCDLCDYNADDETFLNLHKVNSHEEYGHLQQNDLMKVFYNALGNMMMETNELLAKMNRDTNKSMWKIMETQDILEATVKEIKKDIGDLKSNSSAKEGRKTSDAESNTLGSEKDKTAKNNAKKTESKKGIPKQPNDDRKEKVSWIGTSISKALKKAKFEKDLGVNLNITKAYCIKEEDNARYRHANFKAIVPQVIERDEPDTVVLQTGSIEITNIDVNKALMDNKKNIEEYKKEWFEKVEEDSKNLKYANSVYDQLWLKKGSPENIQIVDLDLECSGNFRDLVYGKHDDVNFDGIHLSGEAASRQFTYRVIKMLKVKVYSFLLKKSIFRKSEDHCNCPQAQYQQTQRTNQRSENHNVYQSQARNDNVRSQSYADAVSGINTGQRNKYNVPTYNRYEHFNC